MRESSKLKTPAFAEASAGRQNSKLIEGVRIKELIRHEDKRGFFEELIRVTDDFFKEGFGQLSHSLMKPGIIKAWHIHKTQIDWWYVARGSLKVALYDLRAGSPTHKLLNEFLMGEREQNIVLKIPAGVAHGCKTDTGEAELFYITSKIYNPAEEGRIPHDDPEIGFNWLKFQ
jgi:dTDP-4-dehydrorhamnose 3,5-epimerase